MARLPRIVIPGAAHHVTQRGNRRLPVFFGDEDRRAYLRLLTAAMAGSGTRCLAWCLMDNHVHLILVPETEDALRATLGETHRRYTRRVNFREGWRGHLFQGRFASYPMDDAHLIAAVRYVENNPVAAGRARAMRACSSTPASPGSPRLASITCAIAGIMPGSEGSRAPIRSGIRAA